MAGMCCGVNMGETETSAPVEPSSKSARRRRMEIHQFNFVPTDSAVAPPSTGGGRRKRQKIDAAVPLLPPRECVDNAVQNCEVEKKDEEEKIDNGAQLAREIPPVSRPFDLSSSPARSIHENGVDPDFPKFGMTSVCGRRRDMEDAVAVHPSFCGHNQNSPTGFHFFGVYDGHGCSHVSNYLLHMCNRLNTFP